jgi:hypothetical protein
MFRQLIIYIKKRNDGNKDHLIINCRGKILTRKQRFQQTKTKELLGKERRYCNLRKHTRKLPWLTCMQVDFHQSTLQNFLVCDLFVKIMADQLLITRIKPKPRRECRSNVPQPHKNFFLFFFFFSFFFFPFFFEFQSKF